MMPPSSIAIANNQLETSISMEDYVVVQQPDEVHGGDVSVGGAGGSGDDDDASYDYCEDVFSHGAPDADDQSVTSSIGSDDAGAQKDNITLTVPFILMKDLDEAHAAAKLARVPRLSEENAASSTAADEEDTQDQEPVGTETGSRGTPTRKEASGKTAASSGSKSTKTTRAEAEEKDSSSSVPTVNLSRTSNKKRRKKLKLMKKAQAATSAKQAIIGATSSSKTKKQVVASFPTSTTRGTSRKVANIAVACARETMASYRQEVLCSTVG
mmetsp:Transcript_104645/g.293272  ORF Transcript_104645/g.293272 Transcript_104645/m.293272 type:complete len:269 (+) Transcript_104645:179-985(+)